LNFVDDVSSFRYKPAASRRIPYSFSTTISWSRFDTRLTYDEFSIFINDLQHWGYERLDEYSSGIQELIEAKPITENNQDVEKIRKGLLISLKSQELSEVLATKIKQAIHEVFENEKKRGGLMNKEPSLEPKESSIIREALYLLTPQLP